MGRLIRWPAAVILACCIGAVAADRVSAFDGFGEPTADSTYGEEISFEVGFDGTAPDRLELLISTPGNEGSFVAPVDPSDGSATYIWNTAVDHVTPNTPITYQWRATDGDDLTLSESAMITYDDDRPGLDWEQAQLGEATVHWYGDAESQARRFGEVTAVGVERAESLLGSELAGPVDVFVYESRDEFFGALGPGAREWTGAAAFSDIRTIFMWLEGGSADYLEVAMVHEVTHIVFHDATDNSFHEPARWLNEGIATWSEQGDAGAERSIVESEAEGDGLFAFEAISEQFPIGERGSRLSYAQGTTMVDLIVDSYGQEAVARIAAAYRDGASDDEALEAGAGTAADELYADFFAEFGVDEPMPIAAEPIGDSTAERPEVGEVDSGGVEPGAAPAPPPGEASPGEGDPPETSSTALVVLGAVAVVGIVAAAFVLLRRRGRGADA